MYCTAQSGSDWAEHFLFRGEAAFVDGKHASDTVELVSTRSLTERDTEGYDTETVIAPIRDAAIATLRGSRGSDLSRGA